MPNSTTLGVYVHGNKTTNNNVNSTTFNWLGINYKAKFVEHLIDYKKINLVLFAYTSVTTKRAILL